MIQRIGAGAAVLGLAGVTSGCNSENVLTWVQTVITAFKDALPIFQQILPNQAALLEKALVVAQELQTALKNKTGNAVDFLEQLIAPGGLFNQIIDSLGLIADPQQRAVLSGILLLADIALRLIAQHLQTAAAIIIAAARKRNATGVKTIEAISGDILVLELKNLRF
jgi:hypothetical protein